MDFFSKKVIDKRQLLSNYNNLKKQCNKKICAVVKADGYGHSLDNICSVLNSCCDFYAVNNIWEAIKVRKINKDAKVLILGVCSDYILASKYNISCMIESFIDILYINSLNISLKVHLKINTGMNRFGIGNFDEFKKVLTFLNTHKNIVLEGVFTHCFNCQNKDITLRQIITFKKYISIIKQHKNIVFHIGGSGIINYKDYLNDIPYIRCGIALYGYNNLKVKPIMQIKSKVVNIVYVKSGDYIGYDSSFKAKTDMKIGVIPLGYADGINKEIKDVILLKNNNRYNRVGKVCMDCFMIDLKNDDIKLFDEFLVFNDANSWIDKNNSAYSILTSFIGSRTLNVIE